MKVIQDTLISLLEKRLTHPQALLHYSSVKGAKYQARGLMVWQRNKRDARGRDKESAEVLAFNSLFQAFAYL